MKYKLLGCCCFDLRTGTKIIARFDLAWSFISVVSGIIGMVTPEGDKKASVGFGILVAVLHMVACYFVLKGVKENNPEHFKYWIIMKGIGLAILLILIIVLGILILSYTPESEDYTTGLLVILEVALICALLVELYFWIVVRSYKSQLRGDVNVV